MGNLIGDYIHAHARNYYKYGTAKPGESPSGANGTYNFIEEKNNIIKKWINPIITRSSEKKFKAQETIEALDNLYKSKNNKAIEQVYAKVLRQMESQLDPQKLLKGAIKKYSIITDSGDIETIVKYKNKVVTGLEEKLKMENSIDTTTRTYFNTIKKYYIEIQQYIKRQLKKATSKQTVKINFLNSLKKELNDAFVNIIKNYQKISKNKKIKTELIKVGDKDLATIVSVANILSKTPDSNYLGQIGEESLLFALLSAHGVAEKQILNIMKNLKSQKTHNIRKEGISISWTGQERYDRIFDYSKVARNIHIEGITRTADDCKVKLNIDDNGKGTVKTDISISFNKQSPINFSMKNVNLASGRSVTLGTYQDLLHTMHYINNTDFINHWLNVTSKHRNTKGRLGKFVKKDTKEKIDTSLFLSAHNSMKAILATLALVGFEKEIDYFVINNNTRTNNTGNVPIAIIPIGELIDKLNFMTLDNNILSRTISVQVGPNDSKSYYAIANDKKGLWKNEYVEEHDGQGQDAAIAERLGKLLGEIHKTKVKIGIMPIPMLRAMGNQINSSTYYKKN